ncbi:hypothetical protein J2Z62_000728 [Mycoplasmoides fastidiosum]|uniref:Oligopeptide ABC transporter substrate-binding protein n=1 Tax=Mycoplasmoides fastidiosum TaxID=92758 RepID=A0ABU0M0C0_9BACT|nr:hypothetical protein [Mycoplasmoides fastidiosum]MDQ0514290.1 hypothetical protein [Mycoplasmoides fastidiosum]UUD38104.1 hypothetical protein NPA10_01830 [Mycoplasmoides fastidiosum]
MKPNFSKIKKTWLIPLSSVLSMTAGVLMAACSSQQLPYARKEVYYKDNKSTSQIHNNPFTYDYTVDTTVTEYSGLISNNLIEYQYSGETKMDVDGKIIDNQYSRYKIGFDLGSAIYITKKDQTEPEVFDNDETDHEEDDLIYAGVKKLLSNNPRSLNSKNFRDALKTATKLQVVIRDNVYWSDAKGNKTKYKVTAEDFYTKYLRTALTDTTYRRSHGGSEKIDNQMINEVFKNQLNSENRFSTSSLFTNEYLISLFDVDADKLKDKKHFLSKITDAQGVSQDAITFEAKSNNTQANFENFTDKVLLNTAFFSAAPTEYIRDNNPQKNPQGLTQEAADSGYYWYGANISDMLSAGKYYVSRSDLQFKIYQKNPNFYDSAWVNDPKTIETITTEYDGSDRLAFYNAEFASYQDGISFTTNFQNLTDQQKLSVQRNPEKFNLNYRRTPDYNDVGITIGWQPNIYPSPNQGNTPVNYNFNDAFALMMWGKTIKEMEAGDQDLTKHYWVGDGYLFRSILSQAINYYGFTTVADSRKVFWGGLARPDGLINGKDAETSSKKRLIDFENQNEFFFYNAQGEKISKTLAQDQEHWQKNQNQNNIGFQTPQFEKLKEEMKTLLAKFYGDSGLAKKITGNKNQKIEVTFTEGSRSTSAQRRNANTNALNVLNSLDPEHLNFKIEPFVEESLNVFFSNKNATTIFGWGYDLDSYGGFLELITYPNRINTLFNSMAIFADADKSSDNEIKQKATQYPEFTKFATKFSKSSEVFSIKTEEESISFEQFKNAKNKDWANLGTFMKTGKGQSQYNTNFAFTKFAVDYARELTNEESAKLNQEINSLLGFAFPSENSYSHFKNPTEILINQKYVYPIQPYSDNLLLNKFIKLR